MKRLMGINEAWMRLTGANYAALDASGSLEDRGRALGLPRWVGRVYVSLGDPRHAVGDAKATWRSWASHARDAVAMMWRNLPYRPLAAWSMWCDAHIYAARARLAWEHFRRVRDAYRTIPELWRDDDIVGEGEPIHWDPARGWCDGPSST